MKHSGCSEILVKLNGDSYENSKTPGNLVIRVEDNGRGLPEKNNSAGMGQKIMRYRAEKANAVLSFENNTLGGAVVSCTVPAEGR